MSSSSGATGEPVTWACFLLAVVLCRVGAAAANAARLAPARRGSRGGFGLRSAMWASSVGNASDLDEPREPPYQNGNAARPSGPNAGSVLPVFLTVRALAKPFGPERIERNPEH